MTCATVLASSARVIIDRYDMSIVVSVSDFKIADTIVRRLTVRVKDLEIAMFRCEHRKQSLFKKYPVKLG
jgi:hypothetical protein